MIPSLLQFKGVSTPLTTGIEIGKEAITGKDKYGNEFTKTDEDGNKVRDNGALLKDVAQKAAPLLVPGGTQGKKTIEGINATTSGESRTKSGQIRYMTPTNDASQLQGAVFGQSSLRQSDEFYKSGKEPLSKKQSETITDMPPERKEAFYDFYLTLQGPDNKKAISNKVKVAVEAGNFGKGKRLAGEHNAMVQQEVNRLKQRVGGLPEDVQQYIEKTYMIDYDYYESRKK